MHMPNADFVGDRQWQSSIYESEHKSHNKTINATTQFQSIRIYLLYLISLLPRLGDNQVEPSNLGKVAQVELSGHCPRGPGPREQISDMWPTASRCLEITPRSPVENTERR
jgi:hypothetical protein